MYLAVLVLALAQLEQSQREMANLKLMQPLAFPAVLVLEPALPEQFQKSNTATQKRSTGPFPHMHGKKKALLVSGAFFLLFYNHREGNLVLYQRTALNISLKKCKQKSISHN